jgi:histone H3/H4
MQQVGSSRYFQNTKRSITHIDVGGLSTYLPPGQFIVKVTKNLIPHRGSIAMKYQVHMEGNRKPGEFSSEVMKQSQIVARDVVMNFKGYLKANSQPSKADFHVLFQVVRSKPGETKAKLIDRLIKDIPGAEPPAGKRKRGKAKKGTISGGESDEDEPLVRKKKAKKHPVQTPRHPSSGAVSHLPTAPILEPLNLAPPPSPAVGPQLTTRSATKKGKKPQGILEQVVRKENKRTKKRLLTKTQLVGAINDLIRRRYPKGHRVAIRGLINELAGQDLIRRNRHYTVKKKDGTRTFHRNQPPRLSNANRDELVLIYEAVKTHVLREDYDTREDTLVPATYYTEGPKITIKQMRDIIRTLSQEENIFWKMRLSRDAIDSFRSQAMRDGSGELVVKLAFQLALRAGRHTITGRDMYSALEVYGMASHQSNDLQGALNFKQAYKPLERRKDLKDLNSTLHTLPEASAKLQRKANALIIEREKWIEKLNATNPNTAPVRYRQRQEKVDKLSTALNELMLADDMGPRPMVPATPIVGGYASAAGFGDDDDDEPGYIEIRDSPFKSGFDNTDEDDKDYVDALDTTLLPDDDDDDDDNDDDDEDSE